MVFAVLTRSALVICINPTDIALIALSCPSEQGHAAALHPASSQARQLTKHVYGFQFHINDTGPWLPASPILPPALLLALFPLPKQSNTSFETQTASTEFHHVQHHITLHPTWRHHQAEQS